MWQVRLRLGLGGFVGSLVLLWACTAQANPWDLFGYNARAIGMSGTHVAVSNDFTATYYNPAALTAGDEASFGFGFNTAAPKLTLSFDNAERSIAEQAPPSSNGITFGTLFPLGGERVKNRIALGLVINVPTSSLLAGQALDPAIPQWYMYQALPRRIVTALGIGASPWPWLSLGLSVQILAGVEGQLDYELDIVAGQLSRKSVTFDIRPAAAPIAGFEVRPWKGLRLGFAYRAAIDSQVDLPVDLEITGVADLVVTTFFKVQYSPHQFTLGLSYDWQEMDMLFALDVGYHAWSAAPDPAVASNITVGGELLEGTGLDGAFNAPVEGRERSVQLGFRDVVVPRIAVEKRFGFFTMRGGYALRPSPAPVQTSGANYIDGTAHILSAGASARFFDPLGALEGPLNIDVGVGPHFHPKRRHTKVTRQDPVGSYEAGGSMWVFGVALAYVFEVSPAKAAPAVRVVPVPVPVEQDTP